MMGEIDRCVKELRPGPSPRSVIAARRGVPGYKVTETPERAARAARSLTRLRNEARERGIKGRSRMSKAQLQRAVDAKKR